MSRLLDIPLVTTFYGYDISLLPQQKPKWEERYNRLFERGNLFLVEGPHMGNQLEECGCSPKKKEVHRLGVETDSYPYQPCRRNEGEPLRVLMAGRFVEKKGFPDGLRAFATFVEQGGEGRLTIIGDARESKSSQAVKQKLLWIVEDQNIEERVTFRGIVPKEALKDAYYQHHVLLSPSREASSGDNEGGAPVTLIEAQATGMPVISTYHCDIPDVVIDGETGYLVEEGDIESLVSGLKKATTARWLNQSGRKATEHIQQEYAAERCGKRAEKIYRRLIVGYS
jgi:colanic acid/amylovoran biosynthesis glycosyltransferase